MLKCDLMKNGKCVCTTKCVKLIWYEQGRADAFEEFVTEAIEKYKIYNCKICKRKDEERCTFGECTIAFLEQLKE